MKALFFILLLTPSFSLAQQPISEQDAWYIGLGYSIKEPTVYTIFFKKEVAPDKPTFVWGGLLGVGLDFEGSRPSYNEYVDAPLSHWYPDKQVKTSTFTLDVPLMLQYDVLLGGVDVGFRTSAVETYWYSDATSTWWYNSDRDSDRNFAFSYGARFGVSIGKLCTMVGWNDFRGVGFDFSYGF